MTTRTEGVSSLCLVDDDDIYKFLATKMIRKTSLVERICGFSNGLDAINFLKKNLETPENLPDIILLDLNMPIMDGWEFLEEYTSIKPRIGKRIAIYIVSSSIAPSDIERARSIGEVSDYIIKPITREKIARLIATG